MFKALTTGIGNRRIALSQYGTCAEHSGDLEIVFDLKQALLGKGRDRLDSSLLRSRNLKSATTWANYLDQVASKSYREIQAAKRFVGNVAELHCVR